MFNTPPPHRVKTRSVTRAAQEGELQEYTLVRTSTPLPAHADTTFVVGSSRMDLRQPSLRDDGAPHPLPPRSKCSPVSSVTARRKKLELEVAKQKAKILLDLIDKQFAADVAALEENKYSPHNESRAPSVSHVEEWLHERHFDEQSVHELVHNTDSLRPPAAVATRHPDTVEMLMTPEPLPAVVLYQHRPIVTHSPHATLNIHQLPDADADANLHAPRELHEEVRRSFAIDALGESGKPRQNAEDVRAQEILEKPAILADGQWTVAVPLKDPHHSFPESTKFPDATIHDRHYMDDYIDSLPDEHSAATMEKNIRYIHSARGFEIRNWKRRRRRHRFNKITQAQGVSSTTVA